MGCGSLATGRHLLAFLEARRYVGFDVNHALLLAGLAIELPRWACPHERGVYHLQSRFRFVSRSGTPIEFAISEGFFSRLSLNRIARCVAAVMKRL